MTEPEQNRGDVPRAYCDGRPAHVASSDVLTETKQAAPWQHWAAQQAEQGFTSGPNLFGRRLSVSPHRAARIIAAANTADHGRNAQLTA
ncbi:hypothetical protein [Polymorphospora lycopeni]|uniref:Uncharacterized protein n=1 Tax=Polymorphospora lycopeni TaxID=3140240 RepID=A0ABV5CNI2_9ACTN